jgi:hypothetical protein
MDSTHSSTHFSHGNDTSNDDLLDGIHDFTDTTDSQTDLSQWFASELFQQNGQDFGNGVQSQSHPHQHQSQPQSQQSLYPNPSMSQQSIGRSQSPAMPAFHQSQQHGQYQQYSQPQYDPRIYGQMDPRIFQQRPSASPTSFDTYSYLNQYGGQTQQMNAQARSSQPSATQYAPRPPSYGQYPGYDTRNPTLPQSMDPELARFSNMQYSGQGSNQQFVSPSVLDGTLNGHQSNSQPQQPQRPQSNLYYPTPGQGVAQLPQQMQQYQHSSQGTMQSPHMNTQYSGSGTQSMPPNNSGPVSNLPMKKARGRPRKDASGAQAGSVTTDSGSDLDIVDEPPESPPDLITVAPPTDARTRAIYDAIKAVWQPRNKPAQIALTKAGISRFGDVIRGLRDQWKTRNDNLKKAEADQSPTAANAPALRAETAQYRQTTEILVNKTAAFGHHAVLKRYVLDYPIGSPFLALGCADVGKHALLRLQMYHRGVTGGSTFAVCGIGVLPRGTHADCSGRFRLLDSIFRIVTTAVHRSNATNVCLIPPIC